MLQCILSQAPAILRDMKVALHSNDFSANGISFTLSRNPGFVDDTVRLICTSDAATASDRLDTVNSETNCRPNVKVNSTCEREHSA